MGLLGKILTLYVRVSVRYYDVHKVKSKKSLKGSYAAAKSLQSCPTLCDPIDWQPIRLHRPWDSPGKNTGVGKGSYTD